VWREGASMLTQKYFWGRGGETLAAVPTVQRDLPNPPHPRSTLRS
jgi:hypothetical protein